MRFRSHFPILSSPCMTRIVGFALHKILICHSSSYSSKMSLAENNNLPQSEPPVSPEQQQKPRKSAGMPDWYYEAFIKQEMISRPPTPEKQRKSRASLTIGKGVVGGVNPACEVLTVQDALLKCQDCGYDDMARVNVRMKFGKGQEFVYEDPNEKWICRCPSPPPKSGHGVTLSTPGAALILKLKEKCNEAMKLLMDKMNKGLLQKSWECECNPKFQHGVDDTPTPSTCGIRRSEDSIGTSNTNLEKHRIHHKTADSLDEEVSKYLQNVDISENLKYTVGDKTYCPNWDLTIEEYLEEKNAEFLLKEAGALDDQGFLLCSYSDFYQVEHDVKSLLVELAKNCINEYMLAKKREQEPELEVNDQDLTESFEKKMERRGKMHQVLQEELEQCCPAFVARKKKEQLQKKIKTKIYRGSVPIEVPTRGLHSITVQQYAKDIGNKIFTMIDRKSVFDENFLGVGTVGKSTAVGEDDLVEIMPFQYRDSFVTDAGKPFEHLRKKRQSNLVLEDPIKAEFKSWTLEHKSKLCYTELEYTKPKTWNEWENLKKMKDFETNGTFTKRERKMYLQIKYFQHWVKITRKNNAIRSYSHSDAFGCTLAQPKDEYIQIWRGPYPPCVLSNIRALPRMKRFKPKSTKYFYKALRKLEKHMYETAPLLLENYDRDNADKVNLELLGEGIEDENEGEGNEEELGEFDEIEELGEIEETDEMERMQHLETTESRGSIQTGYFEIDYNDEMQSHYPEEYGEYSENENEIGGENVEEFSESFEQPTTTLQQNIQNDEYLYETLYDTGEVLGEYEEQF